MFLVLKSFTNGVLTASKGKVIEIKDKKVSDILLKAGVVASYSKKEMTNAEKDKEIVNLNKTISDMQVIIDALTEENNDLKAKLEEQTSDFASNLSENNDNLDNNDGETPSQEDNKNE